MRKTVSPGRVAVLVLLPLLLTVAVAVGLYQLQIVHGDAYYERSLNTVVSNQTVPASRGSIFDRNGRILAYNRVGYNVTIDRERLVAGGDPNGTLLTLVALADEAEAVHGDTLPITVKTPFRYLAAMTASGRVDIYDTENLCRVFSERPESLPASVDEYRLMETFADSANGRLYIRLSAIR